MADQKNDVNKTTTSQGSQGTGSTRQGQTGMSSTDQSGSVTGAASAAARSLYDQAKETAGQAYEAVTDKATTTLDEKKSTLSEGLSTVADSLRKAGDNLGQGPTAENALADAARKYGSTAAEKIQGLAQYFEQKDVRTMARDLENYARRNPAVFIGAAFGLGLLAARFLKSSSPNRGTYGGYGRDFETSNRSLGTGSLSHEEESGQGLQMADQSFEPTGINKPSQNVGGTQAGATSSTTSTAGGTSKKKPGGASTKNTSSARDSLGNPM
jgi:hypothetical protein